MKATDRNALINLGYSAEVISAGEKIAKADKSALSAAAAALKSAAESNGGIIDAAVRKGLAAAYAVERNCSASASRAAIGRAIERLDLDAEGIRVERDNRGGKTAGGKGGKAGGDKTDGKTAGGKGGKAGGDKTDGKTAGGKGGKAGGDKTDGKTDDKTDKTDKTAGKGRDKTAAPAVDGRSVKSALSVLEAAIARKSTEDAGPEEVNAADAAEYLSWVADYLNVR